MADAQPASNAASPTDVVPEAFWVWNSVGRSEVMEFVPTPVRPAKHDDSTRLTARQAQTNAARVAPLRTVEHQDLRPGARARRPIRWTGETPPVALLEPARRR